MFEGRRLTDTPRAIEARETWEHARRRFTESLMARDPAEASALAMEALAVAVEANERLATAHAEIMLRHRFGTRAASSSTLGARVHPERGNDALRSFVGEHFDLVVLPVRWKEIEVEEGRYR